MLLFLFRISGITGGARIQAIKRISMMFSVTHNEIGPMLECGLVYKKR